MWLPLEKRNDSSKDRGELLLRFTKSIAVIDNYAFSGSFGSTSITITDANKKGIPFLIEGKWNKDWKVKDSTGQRILLHGKVILIMMIMIDFCRNVKRECLVIVIMCLLVLRMKL